MYWTPSPPLETRIKQEIFLYTYSQSRIQTMIQKLKLNTILRGNGE
ncbi:hypothetical protein M595_1496 [Lyngbya aestuarii BL J]|uniref:Uncharacterized protein n=1 Tax=Lyngbya aestuarii BL J TaxID=1348334 RepID=U7QMN2_9CYAN|nr:hypothetical protein M595_1496 [Lyngbya aestuarii BL J]